MIRRLVLATALVSAMMLPAMANEHYIANDHHFTMSFKDKPLHAVLEALAKEGGTKLVCDEKLEEHVTVDFKDADLEEAFEHLLGDRHLKVVQKGHELHVVHADAKGHH